jgi:hypothetical protein
MTKETLQKNMGIFRKMGIFRMEMKDLVALFFENGTKCPVIKEHVFSRVEGDSILSETHHQLGACFAHPCPRPT